MAVTSARKG